MDGNEKENDGKILMCLPASKPLYLRRMPDDWESIPYIIILIKYY